MSLCNRIQKRFQLEIQIKVPPQSSIILIMTEEELISLECQPEDRACKITHKVSREKQSSISWCYEDYDFVSLHGTTQQIACA